MSHFKNNTLLQVCATSRMVPGLIPGGVTGDISRGPPDRTMCPEVDSASESEYQGFLLGKRRPVRLVDDPPPLQCRNIKKIRGLNLPVTP